MTEKLDFEREQLLNYIGDVLDGTLDDDSSAALNQLLKESAGARQFYQEHMELHSQLFVDYGGIPLVDHMPGLNSRRNTRRFPVGWLAGVAAVAACVALLLILVSPRQADTAYFATLDTTMGARWESSDLPTTTGSRLGKGTLRLAEGMVSLRYDSGAKMNIEAPAEVTLVDSMLCILTEGVAMVEVPDSAIGFRINTPAANVVDFGTRFSVVVDRATGFTHTQVYEGHVEVEQQHTGEVLSLRTGQRISIGEGQPHGGTKGLEASSRPATVGPETLGPEWHPLEPYKDAYIGRAFGAYGKETHRSESLLLVKNGDVQRKAYLGFDLGRFQPETILGAELKLHFEPTGWGVASLVPDATFAVYGLIKNEPWDEGSIVEANAPANQWHSQGKGKRRGGDPRLAPDKVRKLGSFVIEQGVQRGEFGIKDEALADYLREHAGKEITLIVVRETRELETNGLVHGFASRRHPSLRPPTLAIRLKAR